MINIAKNLNNIKERIARACERSGRSAEEVSLVAVSKTVPPELILEAVNSGVDIFGENRVQEFREKYPLFPDSEWHIIGHLQTNKVKYAVGKASLIHSVDSLHLACAIDDCARKMGVIQNILLEVNISGEESKYGLTTREIPTIIKEIENLKNISFKGFMTMVPKDAAEEEIRSVFSRARLLFEEYVPLGATVLSMGMSGDFELAVEEGATHVRVGSSIFKEI